MPIYERIYLDYAGTSLATPELIDAVSKDLKKLSLANPHSRHYSGQLTGAIVDAARNKILEFFGTNSKEYSVIFMGNTTQALKTVAENFDFGNRSSTKKVISTDLDAIINGKCTCMMLRNSHTSVLGLREIADVEQIVITEGEELNTFLNSLSERVDQNGYHDEPDEQPKRSLFVMTAASNFCGRKFDLSLIDKVQKKLGPHWAVCLDAAAFVGTSPLQLNGDVRPDFVAFSFYKMFGYPTGLAVLLVRNDRDYLLQKKYFGGGTVKYALLDKFKYEFKDPVNKRFEDGTLNFTSIVTLRHGFDDLERFGGIKKIQENTMTLAERVYSMLTTKKHANGAQLAVIYGHGWKHVGTPTLKSNQGPVVAFNLLRDDGSYVGFIEVEKMCDLFGIELRTGCFCNIGACASYLNLDDDTLEKYFIMGKTCGDETDLIDGKPVGAVRISLGRLNTHKDIDVFENMIDCCFLSSSPATKLASSFPRLKSNFARLSHLFVYPVKSCAAITPKRWKISNAGLLYDRRWMVISGNGTPMTQKRYPALCTIIPGISNHQLILKDRYGKHNSCVLSLSQDNSCVSSEKMVCVNSMNTIDCGDQASKWIEELHPSLGDGARLVQVRKSENGVNMIDSYDSINDLDEERHNFSSQADFLLICRRSVEAIAERVGLDPETVLRRFRPNFVIEHDGEPFDEDNFKELTLGSARFEVVDKCTRCQMICIDQETGEKDPNILIALRDLRMTFGVYLKYIPSTVEQEVVVGNAVKIVRK